MRYPMFVLFKTSSKLMAYLLNVKDHYRDKDKGLALYIDGMSQLIQFGEELGIQGNLWHLYITYFLIQNENTFSIGVERTDYVEGSISRIAIHDFQTIHQLYKFDWQEVDQHFQLDLGKSIMNYVPLSIHSGHLSKASKSIILKLTQRLASSEIAEDLFNHTHRYYMEYGVGKFGLHRAFRWREESKEIVPIMNIDEVRLQDLIGYSIQKQKLIDNTEAFIQGKKANNVLLYGDSGTGKSSAIKGLLNAYFDQGLRMIEIYKHQFRDLPLIIEQIKDRNYYFIICMDDLSFEDFEIEYKYLKAVIEGGLEKKPDNVLIYATSNRRHLIKESWKDRDDFNAEVHSSDTMQEKLSLADRFGISIMYLKPSQEEYLQIIEALASKHNLKMAKDVLHSEALKWELQHGGRSGRAAQQFIHYILGSKY